MTTASQQAELEKPVTRTVYFVEFQFKTGTSRLSTANFPITWGGYEWAGVGSIGSIGTVEESDGLEARPLTFSINAADPSWLAMAIGPVDDYRGRPAKMWMCPLTESFQLIDTPIQCWSGQMDMVTVGLNGDTGTISMKCETSAYGLKRRPALRLNAAQQKKEYPTDTGFDYLTDLIRDPGVWLSAKFQKSAK